ncbi:MAG: site-specific DNA-methyltransferase, partial [Nitrospirae bacterium]|nr:site-specific DNA-methyltransferase [Nitrospirota bacterium]
MAKRKRVSGRSGRAGVTPASKSDKTPIEQYDHPDKKRKNNPPVGLVTPETDRETGKKTYAYDPHLDPQLVWAGKAEHTSFAVPTVSLHVHERIDPRTIVEAVRKRNGNGHVQLPLFESSAENPPLREAIDFYKHDHNWSNRLIAGDSLLVMNSLIEKEGLAGQVQMVYLDPPYGIRYGSNFQPFVNKRDVKDGKDEDLTQEPEMIRAFRDTWELGIHSYLTYLRDRLLLARELLHESGSCFVQISDENVHLVRNLMDEVFGVGNFIASIAFKTSIGLGAQNLDRVYDHTVWYSRDKDKAKYRQLYLPLERGKEGATRYNFVRLPDGEERLLTEEERENLALIPEGARFFTDQGLTSRTGSETTRKPFVFEGKEYVPTVGGWRTSVEGLERLAKAGRILKAGTTLRFKKFFDDFGAIALTNFWADVGGGIQSRSDPKIYAVQTNTAVIQRCLLMATDPGDLVFDPTCGSGTTAFVAEQWGRRWITCDTSRVAVTLAKQRLMTALFDYYELAHPHEGVGSGFKYKTVPHIMLKSVANNEPPAQETLYDQPFVDTKKARVTGPFTVEAVPAPVVLPIPPHPHLPPQGGKESKGPSPLEGEGWGEGVMADASIARSGPTLRHAEW